MSGDVQVRFCGRRGAKLPPATSLRVTDLGMSALNSTGLREHAHSYLEELRQRTSYTVNLSVLDGGDILYVDRARSFRRGQSKIDLDLHPGSRLPAYCTSMGKLLLANLPDEEQRDLFTTMKLTKRGPNTITSKKALRDELEEVRDAGFAVNDQELAPELHSISAPVRNEAREVVAAVNMAAHSSMISLEELVDALGPHLVSTADRISARLGYRRDDES
jgi:IclR family transcriptional regulator, pca regulon regulatory protein